MSGSVWAATLSPPDGFHHYEFCLVRDTPCPAAPRGLSSVIVHALRRMPRDTQGPYKSTLVEAHSVLDDEGSRAS